MSRPRARANPGRVAAARASSAIESGAFADEAELPPGADGRLAWFLLQGSLKHQAELDAVLQQNLKQPLEDLDPPVRACLRLGAFEKLHGRTAPHAVVQQWVEVARHVKAGRAHGLINAILRRVRPLAAPTLEQRLNHPQWLLDRWTARYGEDWTAQRCAANQRPARTCAVFRADPGSNEPEGADAAGGNPALEPAGPPAAYWVRGELPLDRAWVMDPSAIEVADRFAAAVGQGRVLDACASPGGKTLRLWSKGLEVDAADREKRLPRLRENLERLGAQVAVRAVDWQQDVPEGSYDGILVDAPCTGLGTLRRHPEIRWRRTEADLGPAGERQLQLLLQLADPVVPGGVLGFAVCSPEPEEGPEVTARFLEQRQDYALDGEWESSDPEHDLHQLFLLRRAP